MAVNGVKEDSPPPVEDLPKLELAHDDDKHSIRKKVWDYLEKNNLVNFPRPVYNRIPNFKGANVACDKVTELDVYKRARVIKVNPDKPQEQARFRILEARKTLLVPTPRLRSGLFNKITPPEDAGQDVLRKCATSQGVKEHSSPIGLDDQIKVDLVIIGSVAVSPKGWRIGKGEGFADLEYAMMATKGSVNENTCVVTAVHDCQVFDKLPDDIFGAHDVTVDFIVTPTRVIEVKPRLAKPRGVIWSMLTREKFDQVPILKKLRYSQMREGEDVRLKEELENNVALVEIKEQVIEDGLKEIEIEESPRRERRQRNRRGNRRYSGRDREEGQYTADNEGEEGERRPNPRRRNRRRTNSGKDEDKEGDSRGEDGEAQDGEHSGPRQHNRNRRNRRPRRNTGGEEGQTGESGTEGDGVRKEEGEGKDGPREGQRRRRPPRRNRQRPRHDSQGGDDGEHEEGDHQGDQQGDHADTGDQPPRRRRRNRRRRHSEHSDAEDNKEYGSGQEGHSSPRVRRRGNKDKTPAVYIGSIPRKARVSEVKQAIRDRDVNPLRVIWHAGAARTFLLFTSQDEARAALTALEGLLVLDKPVRVELAKGTDTASKPDDQPGDEPSKQPGDEPGNQQSDQPSKQQGDQPADQVRDHPGDQPSKQVADQPSDQHQPDTEQQIIEEVTGKVQQLAVNGSKDDEEDIICN